MTDWREKFLPISWSEAHELAFSLSQKILATETTFDVIVAIARGGLAVAQMISDTVNLPIAAFTVESYKDLKQTSLPHITYGFNGKLHNKKILLVDDVSDTGKTFIRGIGYLEELGATRENIKTCTLHFKPHSEHRPDFFAVETPKWVIYPSEVGETIKNLIPMWKKENVSADEIKKRLFELGFPKTQVEYFLNQN